MPMTHDRRLFDRLLQRARLLDADIRAGGMFGSPALFLGRRMIGCVFGRNIGLKVPAPLAAEAVAEGSAIPFRPYGKPAMREWIEIDGKDLAVRQDLLAAAIHFAATR